MSKQISILFRARVSRPSLAAKLLGILLFSSLPLTSLSHLASAATPTPVPGVITATLEEPSDDQILSGVRNLRGWAFSTGGKITRIEMLIDGVPTTTVPCCAGRGDVQAHVPGAPAETGFSAAWNWGLVADGEHDVLFRITDATGSIVARTAHVTVATLQDESLGGFLSDTRFAGATCSRTQDRVCCNNVVLVSQTATQLCNDVCYEWDQASQGMVATGATCNNPVPVPTPTKTPGADGCQPEPGGVCNTLTFRSCCGDLICRSGIVGSGAVCVPGTGPTPAPSKTPSPGSTTPGGGVTPTPTPTGGGGELCGNGVLDGGEDCDGNDLNLEDCNSLVGGDLDPDEPGACTGSLGCDSSCHFITSTCVCPCVSDFDCNLEINCEPFIEDCTVGVTACLNGFCATSPVGTSEICNGVDPDGGDPRC
jgi:hypothetical protein